MWQAAGTEEVEKKTAVEKEVAGKEGRRRSRNNRQHGWTQILIAF